MNGRRICRLGVKVFMGCRSGPIVPWDYCVPVGETVQLKALGLRWCEMDHYATGEFAIQWHHTMQPGTWLAVLEMGRL